MTNTTDREITIATGKRNKYIITATKSSASYEFDCVSMSGKDGYYAKCEEYITQPVYTVYNANNRRVDSFTWSDIEQYVEAA